MTCVCLQITLHCCGVQENFFPEIPPASKNPPPSTNLPPPKPPFLTKLLYPHKSQPPAQNISSCHIPLFSTGLVTAAYRKRGPGGGLGLLFYTRPSLQLPDSCLYTGDNIECFQIVLYRVLLLPPPIISAARTGVECGREWWAVLKLYTVRSMLY